jgi:uncharacterized protein (DUF433 family)
MDWRRFIHSNPDILVGKPVIKGTRLSVDFILRLFGSGWTREQVIESYPILTDETLSAVFEFAAECVQDEMVYLISQKVA